MKKGSAMQRFRILTRQPHNQDPQSTSDQDQFAIARTPTRQPLNSRAFLIAGATALAGAGLGLIAVIAGSFLFGLATEAVLAPTLLAKVAGGITGAGAGMAKGVRDNRREAEETNARGGRKLVRGGRQC
jgi:hypothetical protein